EGPGDSGRRRRRLIQGESSPRVSGQYAADVQHARQHSSSLRHRGGQGRDEYRGARSARDVVTVPLHHGDVKGVSGLSRKPRQRTRGWLQAGGGFRLEPEATRGALTQG